MIENQNDTNANSYINQAGNSHLGSSVQSNSYLGFGADIIPNSSIDIPSQKPKKYGKKVFTFLLVALCILSGVFGYLHYTGHYVGIKWVSSAHVANATEQTVTDFTKKSDNKSLVHRIFIKDLLHIKSSTKKEPSKSATSKPTDAINKSQNFNNNSEPNKNKNPTSLASTVVLLDKTSSVKPKSLATPNVISETKINNDSQNAHMPDWMKTRSASKGGTVSGSLIASNLEPIKNTATNKINVASTNNISLNNRPSSNTASANAMFPSHAQNTGTSNPSINLLDSSNPNRNNNSNAFSVNSKSVGLGGPFSINAGTSSQSVAVNGADIGLDFPISASATYSKLGGYIAQAQIAHKITTKNAFALALELGTKQRRYSATLGQILSTQQRIKFTTEYLTQDLDFSYQAGTIDQWIGQMAYGVAYQYILPKGIVNDINFGATYSKANSKELNDVYLSSASLDQRRIAGGADKNISAGVDLVPTQSSVVGLELDYDNVKYDTKYDPSHSHDASGLGGKISYEQLINQYLKFKVSGSNRKPYNDYSAEVNWLLSSSGSNRLEMGVIGGYTPAHDTIPNDTRLGVNFNYTMGSNPLAPPEYYSVGTARKASDDLVQWTSVPAVHMAQVLAIKDELVSTLGGVNPALGIVAGGDSVTLTGNNIGDSGVASVLFSNAGTANSVVDVNNTTITLKTPPYIGPGPCTISAPCPVDVTLFKTNGRSLTLHNAFSYYTPAPGLDPQFGLSNGGTQLIINNYTGENNINDSVLVTFSDGIGQVQAQATVSGQTLTLQSPNAYDNNGKQLVAIGKPLKVTVGGKVLSSTYTYYDIQATPVEDYYRIEPISASPIQGLFKQDAVVVLEVEGQTYTLSGKQQLTIPADGTYILTTPSELAKIKAKLKEGMNGVKIPLKFTVRQTDHASTTYTYLIDPILKAFSPSIRLQNGGTLTITAQGDNFDSQSKVCSNVTGCVGNYINPQEISFSVAADTASQKYFPFYVKDQDGDLSGVKNFYYADVFPNSIYLAGQSVTLSALKTIDNKSLASGLFTGTPIVRIYTDVSAQPQTQVGGDIRAKSITADGSGIIFTMPSDLPINDKNDLRKFYLQVTNGNGIDQSSVKPFDYQYAVPAITKIVPPARLLAGTSTNITVQGNNFVDGSQIKDTYGTAYTTKFNLDGTLTVVMPSEGIIKTLNLSVTNPNGAKSASSLPFTYTDISDSVYIQGAKTAPLIQAVSGTPFVVGSNPTVTLTLNGTSKTITGTATTDGNGVTFKESDIPNVPPTNDQGTVIFDVKVTNVNGDQSSQKKFTYIYSKPVIASISPVARLISGSSINVTVKGSNFVDGSQIKDEDGVTYTTKFNTDGTLTVTLPIKAAAGILNLSVTNPNGAKSTNSVPFIYTDITDATYTQGSATDPVINVEKGVAAFSSNPTVTLTLNGTSKAITGTATTDGDGVTFKESDIPNVPPTNDQGTVIFDVKITNVNGDQSSQKKFTYTYSKPVITRIVPPARLLGGSKVNVTMQGSNFVDGSQVVDDKGVKYETTFNPDGSLTVVTPSQTTTGTLNLFVVNPNNAKSTNSKTFAYTDITDSAYTQGSTTDPVITAETGTAPFVAGSNPTVTLTLNGTSKTIIGMATVDGNGVTFKESDIPNLAQANDQGVVTFTAQITNVNGDQSSTKNFVYTYNKPGITSISPSARLFDGPTPDVGIPVTLTGTNFVSGTTGSKVCVQAGSAPAMSDYCYTPTSAATATTIPISILKNTKSETLNLYVRNSNGATSTSTTPFIYTDVTLVSPPAAGYSQGSLVTLKATSGSPFLSGKTQTITFYSDSSGTQVVPGVSPVITTAATADTGTITFTMPAMPAVATYYLKVVNAEGDKSSLLPFTYTAYIPPQITSATRWGTQAAVLNGGGALPTSDPVTVTGSNFTTNTKVYLKNANGDMITGVTTSLVSDSNLQITVIPVSATGYSGSYGVCVQTGDQPDPTHDQCIGLASMSNNKINAKNTNDFNTVVFVSASVDTFTSMDDGLGLNNKFAARAAMPGPGGDQPVTGAAENLKLNLVGNSFQFNQSGGSVSFDGDTYNHSFTTTSGLQTSLSVNTPTNHPYQSRTTNPTQSILTLYNGSAVGANNEHAIVANNNGFGFFREEIVCRHDSPGEMCPDLENDARQFNYTDAAGSHMVYDNLDVKDYDKGNLCVAGDQFGPFITMYYYNTIGSNQTKTIVCQYGTYPIPIQNYFIDVAASDTDRSRVSDEMIVTESAGAAKMNPGYKVIECPVAENDGQCKFHFTVK